MNTRLLGMGNPILSDDAVGIRLVHDFKKRIPCHTDLEIIEDCSVGGLNLLEFLSGCFRLIIVDSIKTKNGVPGNWYHMTADGLRETMNLNNVHDVNFATAVELGRRMGLRIPRDEDIHIFAVEIDDNLTFSERMTTALEDRYPTIAEEILAAISRLISNE